MVLSQSSESRAKSWHKDSKQVFWNCGIVHIFENNSNNQNFHEENSTRLNSGSASYHSVKIIFSACLLYRSVKIRIYRNVIMPMVLCGC
jgi:hypothetical protein